MQGKDGHIKILFEHEAFEDKSYEGAWCIKVGENFELRNILFYAKEFALGDIISTKMENGKLVADKLIKDSGHSTIRIYFESTDTILDTIKQLEIMGCDYEHSNLEKLIAIDIPPSTDYKLIKQFLDKGFNDGLWDYQEACISSSHSS